ncbi:MAG: PspC domain-containing protein [Bacteroidales bacterium]|nr:PspC domain-containing protein [Bacteroidales bacterium]
MKKAIKINLNGSIFHIDEDAYEMLKKYLDAISRHFSNKEEGEEILRDIESRIAELFQEKKKKEDEIISISLVKEVIEIMGDPEEIVDPVEDGTRGSGSTQSSYTGRSRRLYRDPENSVLGGVSGGLGAYFSIDPLIFRILFLVFFFFGGASILVYLILWIVLPKAETAAQKLEMHGEPVNVSNIEKKVREEYEATKENVKKAANSETAKKTKKAAGNVFSEIGKILILFVKVMLILIGTAFVISGIGIIVGLISGTFIGLHVFPFSDYSFSLGDLLVPFSDPVSITLLMIALTLLFLIPVIAMIYGLVKLIFGIRTRNRGLMIGSTMLWFVALIMTVGILAIETGNYSDNGTSRTKTELSLSSDTLFVSLNELQKREFEDDLAFDFDMDNQWYLTEDLDRIYGQVDLDIEPSGNREAWVEIEKRSKGKNREEAERNTADVTYNYRLRGNNLELNPYFFIDGGIKWRFPRVEITLEIPEGKYVYLDTEIREILDDVDNVDHISEWRMGGKLWLMTGDGLKLVEED